MGRKNRGKAGNEEAKKRVSLKPKVKIMTHKGMSKALIDMGSDCSPSEMVLWYFAVFLFSLVMSLLFNLSIGLILMVGLVYLLFTPKLIYNMKKRSFEKRRFDDANSYLSQMAQSFTSTGNIRASLEETGATFTKGRMHNTIVDAIDKIDEFGTDVRDNEVDALNIISKKYDCERVRYLHDFLIKAEIRGGECTGEFRVLEKVRLAWSDAVLKYHGKLALAKNLLIMEYGMLLGVCVFFLRRFPDTIALINVPMVQLVNAIEVILFLVVFLYMDSKMNESLLRNTKYLTEEEVESYFDYVGNFSAKEEFANNKKLVILGAILSVLLIVVKPNTFTIFLSIALMSLMCCLHLIRYSLTGRLLKRELTRAFPKWLFDIMLLIQTESVEASLKSSLEFAPPVIKHELKKVCDRLDEKPGDVNAYMSFLEEYNIPGVSDTMRKLYSLSVGTGDKEIIEVLIDTNMSALSDAENTSMETKGGMTAIYTYLPLVCISGALITYCAMLIIEVFAKLSGVFGSIGL